MRDHALWSQLRRLLLGTVVEALLAEGVAVVFGSILVQVDPEGGHRGPRLDSYLRFRGRLVADLDHALDQVQIAAIQARLRTIWPELLSVVRLPIGDKLTSSRHELLVDATAEHLEVRFDLEA